MGVHRSQSRCSEGFRDVAVQTVRSQDRLIDVREPETVKYVAQNTWKRVESTPDRMVVGKQADAP